MRVTGLAGLEASAAGPRPGKPAGTRAAGPCRDLAAIALAQALGEVDRELESRKFVAEQGAVRFVFRADTVETFPAQGLLYYPGPQTYAEPPADKFAQAEALEYQKKDFGGAVQLLRAMCDSREQPPVRAAALLRLARNFRKLGRTDQAVSAYHDLAHVAGAAVDGVPAELVARHALAGLFDHMGDRAGLRREAEEIRALLHSGRHRLSRGPFLFYEGAARQWLGMPVQDDADENLAIAEGVGQFWKQWSEAKLEGSGRLHEWTAGGKPVLLFWRGTRGDLVGLAATPAWLERRWPGESGEVRLALTDANGRTILGHPSEPQTVRLTSATRLPWTLHVMDRGAQEVKNGFDLRRRLLLAGLTLMIGLVGVSSYFMARAVTREVALARLQSDFVAAVSHEFRTPLTTLRQLSGLLHTGRVPGEDRRRQYYEVLVRESERLDRLVDNLLNFGRMEAGAAEFRFEPFDPAGLVRSLVDDFQREVSPHGYRIELTTEADIPAVRGDRVALGRAVRNLLDNAVKYSPDRRTIWVELVQTGPQVVIRVRDQGLGIPASEQAGIFQKFVRGRAAKESTVQGSGIGLAMVSHIIQAHGGRVTVQSEPGTGSTFTLCLPAVEAS
ncbi:MAG: HAMP domain-containing histidine kinase [Bryobacterales bacterium]|nr:HAMP domain-containing histidine kinase [Bryobacterales bacterium]